MKTVHKQIEIYDPGDVLELLSFPTYSSSRKKMVADAKRVIVTNVEVAGNGNPSYWVLTDTKKHIRVSSGDLSDCKYITTIDLSALFGNEEKT